MNPTVTTEIPLADLRRNYMRAGLRRADLDPDPLKQLAHWLREAVDAGLTEPNAMVLSTVDTLGQPSSRTVLLKGLDGGLQFFTNYQSRKGRELELNPRASVLFPWIDLERQVIVSGRVERVDDAVSDHYFHQRPYGSRLGAVLSRQSEVIPHRQWLEELRQQLERQYPESGGGPPRPAFWGGYRLIAERIEFWQGRPDRLHDRLNYRAKGHGEWAIERLSP